VTAAIRIRTNDEAGTSLVEVGLSAFLTLLLLAVMTSWIVGVTSADRHHEADDTAVQALREARAHLTRELRGAQLLTAAAPHSLTMWLDSDRDAVLDAGEMVSWEITSEGVLRRSTDDGGSRDVATGLVSAESGFGYDASLPGEVAYVSIDLVLVPEGAEWFEPRVVETEVQLRNAAAGGTA
jgi:hypothetical protein